MNVMRNMLAALLIGGSLLGTAQAQQKKTPIAQAAQRLNSSGYEVDASTRTRSRPIGVAQESTLDRLRGMANGTVVGTNGFENRPGGPSRSTIDTYPRPCVMPVRRPTPPPPPPTPRPKLPTSKK